jgi:capsular exopolysaccharide synthesis family protein
MSRIQQILDKAEREGRMRRTVSLDDAAAPSDAPPRQAGTPAPSRPEPSRHDPPRPDPGRPVALWPSDRPHAAPPTGPAPAAPAVVSPIVTPARAADSRLAPLGITALEPHSAVAEQYRALRTRISQVEQERYYRAILVTSPSPGDGKSVTSLNLALAMAQEFHRRVLLVDADLRDPSLHRLLGIPARPGLSDVLAGSASLDEVMVSLPNCRLTAIPAGSPVDRPSEMLGSAEMRRVLDTLRTQFDRLIVDTPPAAPLADVGVLSPLADGVLLVVRAGRTPRPAIDRAIEDLGPGRIIGLVLNDVLEVAGEYAYGSNASAASRPVRGATRATA